VKELIVELDDKGIDARPVLLDVTDSLERRSRCALDRGVTACNRIVTQQWYWRLDRIFENAKQVGASTRSHS
jgi:hypothetical protein